MATIDLRVIPVPADGDCLYHAFIKGLDIDISPQDLRNYVAHKIQTDKDLYDDLVMEWLDFGVIRNITRITPEIAANRLRTTKEWATSTVIHILALAFNVRVIVFQKINGKFYPEVFPSVWKVTEEMKKDIGPKYKDIYLYRRGYHFELLVRDKPITTVTTPKRYCFGSGYKRSNAILQRGGGTYLNERTPFEFNSNIVYYGLVCIISTLLLL